MNPMQSFLEGFRKKVAANLQGDGEYKDLREDFIKGMEAVRKVRWTLVWIIVSMAILIFLLTIVGIIFFITKDRVDLMITISTISGLSLAGMIYYLSALWRQVTGAEMAIYLAPSLNDKDLMDIIDSLLNTAFPKTRDKSSEGKPKPVKKAIVPPSAKSEN